MLEVILSALWFFLPAGIANSAPVFAARAKSLRFLEIPVDGGKKLKGKRLLGDHKTIRGFVVGFISALLILGLQKFLYSNYEFIKEISYVNYESINILVLGFLFSFGALGGDAIKSFFKRRTSVKPGDPWFPFDQIDYIIGGLLGSMLIVKLEPMQYFAVFIIWFILHPTSTFIAYKLKLKDKPF